MISQTPGYVPALLKGVVIDPQNPLALDFIVDTGDSGLEAEALRQETLLLIKYFLAALTVPEEEMWVNLSPNEPDRIIPQIFGRTAMGMELLAQDYLLKQMTSSLLYPEEETGKKFWQHVRQQAQERFGTSEISTDVFNKVWIVPDKATVYQKGNGAFVVESRLRVMLEEDYHALRRVHGPEPEVVQGLAARVNAGTPVPPTQTKSLYGTNPGNSFGISQGQDPSAPERALTGEPGNWGTGELTKLQTEIMREIILPAIETEVNEGKTFIKLRQIYQAMILATWFKQNLKESLLGKVYVNRHKVQGVDSTDPFLKDGLYERYLQAFQTGVFNYIREDEDAASGEMIPRHYFSGGLTVVPGKQFRMIDGNRDGAMRTSEQQRIVKAGLKPAGTVFRARSGLVENSTPQSLALSRRAALPDAAMLTQEQFAALLVPGVSSAEYYRLYLEALQLDRAIRTDQEWLRKISRLQHERDSFISDHDGEKVRGERNYGSERRDRIWEQINSVLDDSEPAVAGFRRQHPRLEALAVADMAMLAAADSFFHPTVFSKTQIEGKPGRGPSRFFPYKIDKSMQEFLRQMVEGITQAVATQGPVFVFNLRTRVSDGPTLLTQEQFADRFRSELRGRPDYLPYVYGLYTQAMTLSFQVRLMGLRMTELLGDFKKSGEVDSLSRKMVETQRKAQKFWKDLGYELKAEDWNREQYRLIRGEARPVQEIPSDAGHFQEPQESELATAGASRIDAAMISAATDQKMDEISVVSRRIRQLYPGFPDLADEDLLTALFEAMTSSAFLVHDVSLEAILPELEGDAQTALGKGGLGYLEGETLGAYQNGVGVLLKYKRTKTGHEVDWEAEKAEQPVYVRDASGKTVPLKFDVFLNGRRYETQVSWVNRNGTPVFLLYNEEICNELYPDPESGAQRMLQYGFIAKAYVVLMSRLGIHPDILRLNEAQLVFVQKAVEEDMKRNGEKSVFWGTRTVMTNHTPERAALPVFRQDRNWLTGLLGGDLIDDEMYRDHNGYETRENNHPVIRAAEVLARKAFLITTVSEEHGEVTKRHVLPDFSWKTTYVQNGSDPRQWHSELLNAAIAAKGFDAITGDDLFKIGQEQKKKLNTWLAGHQSQEGVPYKTFTDMDRPLFGALRRLVEYKEQGIFIAMVHWITGDADKLYDTPWGKQYGLAANFLIGGPVSDERGWDWANVYRSLQNDPALQGKLVFIDRTGTEIMRLATSACDFWVESPRPTREASGTSHQRAMLNGRLPLASHTGGQLSVVRHRINGWLIDVFKTEGFSKLFDEVADALDSPSHPRYLEMVEKYRVGAQRLYGEYMTEAVGLYRRLKDGDQELLGRMETAFRDAHEKVSIGRMMRDLQKVFSHVMDGTGAAGYESGQIAATQDAKRLEGLVDALRTTYQLDKQAGVMTSFLAGYGSAMDVVYAMQSVKDLEEQGAEPAAIAVWLLAAYNLSPDFMNDLVAFVSGKKQDLQGLGEAERLESIRQDVEDLKRVLDHEKALRWIDEQRTQGQDVPPELQHRIRRQLSEAWESLEQRELVRADAAMLANVTVNGQAFGGIEKLKRGDVIGFNGARETISVEANGRQVIFVTLNSPGTGVEESFRMAHATLMTFLTKAEALLSQGQAHEFREEFVHFIQGQDKTQGTPALAGQPVGSDVAMLGLQTAKIDHQDKEVGGIDLNSTFLDLTIKRDGQGVPLPLPQQPVDVFLNIEGFLPVIIEMVPVESLPVLLGLEQDSPALQQLSRK